ncbi:MAG: helix-hairpin-helix domain-containing protein [Paraprevotella sp.]|nr:helix-hairpin-helix domain-containing protein [Paraprevotella sp.]
MRRKWRDFFYFSKADRRAFLLLACLLMGIALTASFFLWFGDFVPEGRTEAEAPEYAPFLHDLITDSTDTRKSDLVYAQLSSRKVETFVFDPNTADSSTLLRLGLTSWQVRNIYKFRARGGRYHRPEDFSRLYGLTKGDYDRLRPYIRIADEFRLMSDLRSVTVAEEDSMTPHVRQEKFAEGVQVDLNEADTTILKKIPGIGPYYARRIVDYRTRLGGFVSVAQLAEIEGLPDDIGRWFTPPFPVVPSLYINRMSVTALRRHPYLNFYQSKAIVEHRRKYGAIKKLQALSLYEEFSPADLERLQPYVNFEE